MVQSGTASQIHRLQSEVGFSCINFYLKNKDVVYYNFQKAMKPMRLQI